MRSDGKRLPDKIVAPSLIVNGTKDPTYPKKVTEELAQGIPGAKLVLVEEDHLFTRQNPGLLVEPALKLLAKVRMVYILLNRPLR